MDYQTSGKYPFKDGICIAYRPSSGRYFYACMVSVPLDPLRNLNSQIFDIKNLMGNLIVCGKSEDKKLMWKKFLNDQNFLSLLF